MGKFLSRNQKMVAFCLIVGVNLCVKLLGISYNQIALDEPFSIYHAQFSVGHIYQNLTAGNNPPVYEIFLHYWISIFGIDAFWVRLPSVIFSSLASGFWFLAAWHCMSLFASLSVAVLLTFSTQYIYYSHEARAYAMLLMLLGVASYLLVKMWNGDKSYLSILAAAFVSALCIYVHYLALIPICIMALITLVHAPKNKRLFIYMGSLALLLIPISVLVLGRISEISETGLWGEKPVWTQLYGYLNIFLNGRITLAVLALVLLITGILFIRQKEKILDKSKLRYMGIWSFVFGVGYFGMFLISYKQPIFIERYVQVIMPFFFLSLAALFSTLFNQIKLGKLSVLLVLFIFCAQVNIYPSNERNPKMVAEKVREYLKCNDCSVHIAPDWYNLNLAYYYDRSAFSYEQLNETMAIGGIHFIKDARKENVFGNVVFEDMPVDNILYVDAGEFFVTGKHEIFETFLYLYNLEKEDSIDKQTTLYYFKIKN